MFLRMPSCAAESSPTPSPSLVAMQIRARRPSVPSRARRVCVQVAPNARLVVASILFAADGAGGQARRPQRLASRAVSVGVARGFARVVADRFGDGQHSPLVASRCLRASSPIPSRCARCRAHGGLQAVAEHPPALQSVAGACPRYEGMSHVFLHVGWCGASCIETAVALQGVCSDSGGAGPFRQSHEALDFSGDARGSLVVVVQRPLRGLPIASVQ